MTLQDLASGAPAVEWQWLGNDTALCKEVQQRLRDFGLLDGAPDGQFGPVSFWALTQWLQRGGGWVVGGLGAAVARELLSQQADQAFALKPDASLAGRVVSAMLHKGFAICRHPEALNIVYVEGMNPDGTANPDTPNAFNDLRLVLRIGENGVPVIDDSWVATTGPGRYYTGVNKLDPRGAARIALGQFKSWSVGVHMAGRASAHEALVQTAPIDIYRDLNEDFKRAGDKIYTGVFGINQHYGFDAPVDDIGRTSAGCLVGRAKKGHRSFMAMCRGGSEVPGQSWLPLHDNRIERGIGDPGVLGAVNLS